MNLFRVGEAPNILKCLPQVWQTFENGIKGLCSEQGSWEWPWKSQLLEGGLTVPFLDSFSDLEHMTGGRLR